MNILFTSAVDFASDTSLGISAKVVCQAKAAEQAGHDVYISKDFGCETRIERPTSGEVIISHCCHGIFSRRDKYDFLREWILGSGVEAVVVRFDHLDGVFCGFAKKMRAKKVLVAVEFPTFPFDKERDVRHRRLLDSHKYASYFAHRAYARMEGLRIRNAKDYIDYTITYLSDERIWDIPNITYDNGIDLSAIRTRSARRPNGSVRLLAVAKFCRHHGIDRLIRGLAEYEGGRDVHLTLVGIGAESPALERLVSELGLGAVVTFAGVAVGRVLNAYFDEADIAVGSLGLHRIGIALGSTMKSREYCARGMPFIYSSPEKGFDGDEDFALMLPIGDEPIDVTRVVEFADGMSSDEGVVGRMRTFAEERFDWKAQMDRVLVVLESAAEGRANDE